MNIKNNCWVDAMDPTSVYYCGVMSSRYGVTYYIQSGKVMKWFWEGSDKFERSGWVNIKFKDLPIEVREFFSDPFLEIELERFKMSGLSTMDIL